MPNDGRSIPTSEHPDVVTFKVFADGTDITGEYRIVSVIIERVINSIATAHLVLLDGDVAKETFEISEKPAFAHGKEVEIKAGYRANEQSIFKGVIVRHGLKVSKGKPSILKIECKNKAIKLSAKRSTKYFYDVTDSDVMEEVLRGGGATADVEATTLKHKEMVQFYSSDWDFLVMRAEANGKFVVTNDANVSIKKPDFSQNASVKLRYGGNVIDFELEADARTQVNALKAWSWNPADQALADSEAANGSPSVPGNFSAADLAAAVGNDEAHIRFAGTVQNGELQAWADARMQSHQLSRIHGRVQCQGFPDILPAQIVELEGMGARFNGKAFVSGVRHDIHLNEWRTDIEIGINLETHSEKMPDVTARPSNGLLPTVNGLHIGLVTKLEADPDGEDRIQVRLPMIEASGEGTWARVSCLDAGNERGTFFRPEIGDEVIIGFIDDDPRQAIVLGMLNSSAKPAPLSSTDDNHQKGIFTRSKMKVLFDDDKKEITIETPAGNKMIFSDDKESIELEDKNGNKIKMNSDGITIESAKDIVLKASANIKGEASSNLELKASAQAKVSGSAGAEFSASGTTTVKGAMVQIN